MTWLKMDDPRLEEIKEDVDKILVTVETYYKQGALQGHTLRHVEPVIWCDRPSDCLPDIIQAEFTPGWASAFMRDEWSGGYFESRNVEGDSEIATSKVIRWQPMPEPFEGDV